MKNLLHTLLLAGVAPAMAFTGDLAVTPPATSGTPGGDWFGERDAESAQASDAQAAEAAQAALELADRMALVYDRKTADAAAADIAPLVSKLAAQGGEETFWTRMHMAYTGCYGSPELQKMFAPLLPPPDITGEPAYTKSMPILLEVLQTLDDIRGTIQSVQDKAGAESAAETISLFATHLDDCMEKGNSVPVPQGNRIDLVIYFYSSEYRTAAALYKEWGDLQNRSGDYYGSQPLAAAMEDLGMAMENLDLSADPYSIGRMSLICPKLEEQLRIWLSIAADIKDKATADAAVPELRACVERMREIAAPLGHGYERDLGRVSPMFLFLTLACDRMGQRLHRLDYYGSTELKNLRERRRTMQEQPQ